MAIGKFRLVRSISKVGNGIPNKNDGVDLLIQLLWVGMTSSNRATRLPTITLSHFAFSTQRSLANYPRTSTPVTTPSALY